MAVLEIHGVGMGMVDKDMLNRNLTAINTASMTTTQRNAALGTSGEGTMVYDLTLHKLFIRTVGGWEQVTSA